MNNLASALLLASIPLLMPTAGYAKAICTVSGVKGHGWTENIVTPIKQWVTIENGQRVQAIVGYRTRIYCKVGGSSYFTGSEWVDWGAMVVSGCQGRLCNIPADTFRALNETLKLISATPIPVATCRGDSCLASVNDLRAAVQAIEKKSSGEAVWEHPAGVKAVNVAPNALRITPDAPAPAPGPGPRRPQSAPIRQ